MVTGKITEANNNTTNRNCSIITDGGIIILQEILFTSHLYYPQKVIIMVSNFSKKWNLGVIWSVLSFIYRSIFIYVSRVFIWRGIMFLVSTSDKPHELQSNHWMVHPCIQIIDMKFIEPTVNSMFEVQRIKFKPNNFLFLVCTGVYWEIFISLKFIIFSNLLSLAYFSCKRMMHQYFCLKTQSNSITNKNN